MNKEDGGPAFPVPGFPNDSYFNGMTLRDCFAAKVLQGFCANPAVFASNGQCGWKLVNATEEQLAGYCWALADAMLAERNK